MPIGTAFLYCRSMSAYFGIRQIRLTVDVGITSASEASFCVIPCARQRSTASIFAGDERGPALMGMSVPSANCSDNPFTTPRSMRFLTSKLSRSRASSGDSLLSKFCNSEVRKKWTAESPLNQRFGLKRICPFF